MTREEAHNKINKEARSNESMYENYIHSLVAKMIINQIFYEHEALLKAKDEELENMCNGYNDPMAWKQCESVNDFDFVITEKNNLKARSIVAMLFWKMKRQKRVFQKYYEHKGRNNSLTQCYRGMFEQALMDFGKSYAMLKDNKLVKH